MKTIFIALIGIFVLISGVGVWHYCYNFESFDGDNLKNLLIEDFAVNSVFEKHPSIRCHVLYPVEEQGALLKDCIGSVNFINFSDSTEYLAKIGVDFHVMHLMKPVYDDKEVLKKIGQVLKEHQAHSGYPLLILIVVNSSSYERIRFPSYLLIL